MNQHHRRSLKLLRAALRYLWWSCIGTPEERREQWRRSHPNYITMRRVRQAIQEEQEREQGNRLSNVQNIRAGGFKRDARRRGWWSA